MEAAARGDYVGIGWCVVHPFYIPSSYADVAELIRLISASVQSVVFYGFNCQTTEMRLYTTLCMLTGLAGSIIPFQAWFNERRNKVRAPLFPDFDLCWKLE